MSNRRTGEAAPGTVQAVHKYDPCLLVQLGWHVPITHKNEKQAGAALESSSSRGGFERSRMFKNKEQGARSKE